MNIRALLQGVPEIFQYILVLGLVMLILYVCLTITRLLGQKFGKKQYYDNPEAYAKNVPDLFATTAFKRGGKKNPPEEDKANEN